MSIETPKMTNVAYTSNTYTGMGEPIMDSSSSVPMGRRFDPAQFVEAMNWEQKQESEAIVAQKSKDVKRVVKIYIVDPDVSVPLKDSLLYEGEEQMTDLTDEELFFEINLKPILDKHNLKRVKMSPKGKKEKLDPARIRDLSMVVVDIASF